MSPKKAGMLEADEGKGFDPENVDDPRLGENICKMGGRGVLLIKSYMDEVEYNRAGNTVRMLKFNSKAARGGEQ